MKFYAVIDTNVLLSSLLSKNSGAATVRVMEAVLTGRIIPLYHSEILEEYIDVLHRPRFRLPKTVTDDLIKAVVRLGLEVFPDPTGTILPDMDDLIFYEVVMEKRNDNAYLVTGNQKHYPVADFIVTPSEMMDIIDRQT